MQLKVSSLRRTSIRVILLGMLALVFSACHLDMYDQPKYKPLQASDFFADGASARRLVDGTVSRNGLKIDERTTGRVGGDPAGEYVSIEQTGVELGEALVARGQARYKIYCASCHGEKGNGKGIAAGPISKGPLGLVVPGLFYVDELKGEQVRGESFTLADAPDGYWFKVISQGVANPNYDPSKPPTPDNARYTMNPYNHRIQDVNDRWAIIAYIREMQKNPPEK